MCGSSEALEVAASRLTQNWIFLRLSAPRHPFEPSHYSSSSRTYTYSLSGKHRAQSCSINSTFSDFIFLKYAENPMLQLYSKVYLKSSRTFGSNLLTNWLVHPRLCCVLVTGSKTFGFGFNLTLFLCKTKLNKNVKPTFLFLLLFHKCNLKNKYLLCSSLLKCVLTSQTISAPALDCHDKRPL